MTTGKSSIARSQARNSRQCVSEGGSRGNYVADPGSNRDAAIAHPLYGYRLYTSLEAKEIVLKSGKTSTVQEKNRTGFS
jgi:hypothetical protein